MAATSSAAPAPAKIEWVSVERPGKPDLWHLQGPERDQPTCGTRLRGQVWHARDLADNAHVCNKCRTLIPTG